MQSKLDQLGKAFVKDKKTYIVESTNVYQGKAYVYTDRKTFVLFENELDALIELVEVCDVDDEKPSCSLPAKPILKNSTMNIQIVEHNNLSTRITEKLEKVFDELSSSPGEEVFKKAKSMVEVSNSIVNVQMANYKYLTLNN